MNSDELLKEHKRLEQELAPLLTDEFLDTLVKAARTCGHWEGDYWETVSFVQFCFDVAGKKLDCSMEPY